MGGSASKLTRQELETYEACTCLRGHQVLELLDKFEKLGGVRGTSAMSEEAFRQAAAPAGTILAQGSSKDLSAAATGGGGDEEAPAPAGEDQGKKVSWKVVVDQPEFALNPFAKRLCQIFTTEPMSSEAYGDLSFDEFVDMYHALSPRAEIETKIMTCFRLFDFNDDGYLSFSDLNTQLHVLANRPLATGTARAARSSVSPSASFAPQEKLLDEQLIDEIVDRVMRDCDIDGNQRLTYGEFKKVVERMPDFVTKFRVYIQ